MLAKSWVNICKALCKINILEDPLAGKVHLTYLIDIWCAHVHDWTGSHWELAVLAHLYWQLLRHMSFETQLHKSSLVDSYLHQLLVGAKPAYDLCLQPSKSRNGCQIVMGGARPWGCAQGTSHWHQLQWWSVCMMPYALHTSSPDTEDKIEVKEMAPERMVMVPEHMMMLW